MEQQMTKQAASHTPLKVLNLSIDQSINNTVTTPTQTPATIYISLTHTHFFPHLLTSHTHTQTHKHTQPTNTYKHTLTHTAYIHTLTLN